MKFPKPNLENLGDYVIEIENWREALRRRLEQIISKSRRLAAVQLDSSIVGQAELAKEVLEWLKQ